MAGFAMAALLALIAPASVKSPPAETFPRPCVTDPAFRSQDIAIGRWTVTVADRQVATVEIRSTLDGCALHEDWLQADGRPGADNGTGLFTYSPAWRQWHYLWASDKGTSSAFFGTVLGKDEIRYVTRQSLDPARSRLRHWTLTLLADGRVRELSVATEDDGASWTTEYDLYWTRIAEPAG